MLIMEATMEYRRLGNTGLAVSRICLGCMSYGDPAATIAGSNLRWEWALKHEIDASLKRLGTDYVGPHKGSNRKIVVSRKTRGSSA